MGGEAGLGVEYGVCPGEEGVEMFHKEERTKSLGHVVINGGDTVEFGAAITLTLYVSRASAAETCEGDLSGYKMPGVMKARRR